jgi:hypothetical protein
MMPRGWLWYALGMATMVWGLGSLLVLFMLCSAVRAMVGTRLLRDAHAPDPTAWPLLTLIIPACNEGSTLEPAVGTLLAQDYPRLEIVLINDRSTDQTGMVVDQLALRDARVIPLHIEALPAGWLGKVHAMHQGVQKSRGEFILFTDADVHFAPGALRRAVSLAVHHGHDHVAVFPQMTDLTLGTEMVVAMFAIQFMMMIRPHRVGKPGSKAYVGIGAFNMVRRAALSKTPGLEWLRLEIADDMGMALMLSQGGARGAVYGGVGMVYIRWYPTVRAMVQGLEKNLFPVVGHFSPGRAVAAAIAAAWLSLAPFAALTGDSGGMVALGVAVVCASVTSALMARKALGSRFVPTLLAPVGGLVLAVALLRSTWMTLARGGVVWRGTQYPLAELRAGQRLKL